MISGLGKWSPNGDLGRSPARIYRRKHVINPTTLSAKDLHCAWSELQTPGGSFHGSPPGVMDKVVGRLLCMFYALYAT